MITGTRNSFRIPHSSLRNLSPSRGFTLIEMVVVLALLSVVMLLIAATLWGAIKIERADAANFQRTTSQAQLADQFREDVARAIDAPHTLGDLIAAPDCLILTLAGDRHLVYRRHEDSLERLENNGGAQPSKKILPVGGENVSVEFGRSSTDSRLVTMRLIESRGSGSVRREWPIEIVAALGGDTR